MVEAIDIQRVCRACLVDTGPFTDLFAKSEGSKSYTEMFINCTSINNISESEMLPKQMCKTCIELLQKFYKFKQMVLKSDRILKKHLEQIMIKSEFHNENFLDVSTLDSREHDKTSTGDIVEGSEVKIEPLLPKKKRKKAETIKVQNKVKMQCPKCTKSFKKHENFEAHLRIHFGKKPDTKCATCGKVFSTLLYLNRHMQRHKNIRKYQCLTCGKSFAYLQVLKTHEMLHTGTKNFKCHICGAKFIQRSNLKIHLVTHTQEKKYSCTKCGNNFSSPGNLNMHLLRHSGQKNISCTICDMKFYIKSDLLKHMRSHSSERPYSCVHCDKTYKYERDQIRHLRTHTGERPYNCDLCPKSFKTTKVLRNHRMTHTGEKPHKCQICSHAFIQKVALKRHLKSHWKNNQLQTVGMVQQTVSDQPSSQQHTVHYELANPKIVRTM